LGKAATAILCPLSEGWDPLGIVDVDFKNNFIIIQINVILIMDQSEFIKVYETAVKSYYPSARITIANNHLGRSYETMKKKDHSKDVKSGFIIFVLGLLIYALFPMTLIGDIAGVVGLLALFLAGGYMLTGLGNAMKVLTIVELDELVRKYNERNK
jgi:hypothetical protein